MFSDSYVDLLLWDLCYLFDYLFDYIHIAIVLWKLLLPIQKYIQANDRRLLSSWVDVWYNKYD